MGLRTMLSRRTAASTNGKTAAIERAAPIKAASSEPAPVASGSSPVSPVPAAITIPSGSRLIVQSWQDVWIPEDPQQPSLPGHCSVLLGLQGIKHKASRMTVFSTYVYCVSNAKERLKAIGAVRNVLRDFEITEDEQAQLNQLQREIEAVGDERRASVLCSQGEPESLPIAAQRAPVS